MKFSLIIINIFLCVFNNFSTNVWQETLGSTSVEYGTSIIKTLDGGFAVCGYTYPPDSVYSDIQIVKLDSEGVVKWSKIYRGEKNDAAYDIVQTSDSGYIIVGSTASINPDFYNSMLIFKISPGGEVIWVKKIDWGENITAYSVIKTADEKFVVVGYLYSPQGYYGLPVIKLNENGIILQVKIIEKVGIGLLEPRIIPTNEGGYAISGSVSNVDSGHADIFIIKLNELFEYQWAKSIGGPNQEESWSLIQTKDNGFAVAGYSNSYGAGYPDLYIVKLDSIGGMQWSKTYGGDNDDYGVKIINTEDGGYIIAGEAFSYGLGGIDMFVVKIDSLGTVMWEKTFGGSNYDFMRSMVNSNDGGYVAVGRTESFGAGGSDIFIVKMDSSGSSCGNSTLPMCIIGSGGIIRNHPVIVNTLNPVITSPELIVYNGHVFTGLCFTNIKKNQYIIPENFSLHQNYPNPFNPTTKIKFSFPNPSEGGAYKNVRLLVFDLLGRQIASLLPPLRGGQEGLKPGTYEVDWDGSNYASGVYFYRLIIGDASAPLSTRFTQTNKMILLK